MRFYKRFPGDYAGDTGDLSLTEHGAYTMLLDHYYANDGALPDIQVALHRICRAVNAVERKAVDAVATRFFPINGDGRRHNPRADREIANHIERVEHNRHVGALGGRPKKPGNNPDGYVPGFEKEPERNPDGLSPGSKTEPGNNPSHSQIPDKAKTSVADATEGRVTAPECPHEKLIALYHDLLPMCPRVEKWTAARRAAMRQRWLEESRMDPNREKHRGYATVEDGMAYWRRYLGYASESRFLTGKEPGRDGKPPFLATLPWLLKPENFAKVIEGVYHR